MVTTENEMRELEKEIVRSVIDLRNLGISNVNEASARVIAAKNIKNPGNTKNCLENGIKMVEYIEKNGQASQSELTKISGYAPSQNGSLSPTSCGVIVIVDHQRPDSKSDYKKSGCIYNFKLASPGLGERYKGIAWGLIEKFSLLTNSKNVGGKTEVDCSEN